jgi:starch synthase
LKTSLRNPIRVLFVTPELAPWMKSGGLGDVSAALPAALRRIGSDVRILLPFYTQLRAAFKDAVPLTAMLDLGGAFAPARLLAVERRGMVPLFLIDCPDYFQRDGNAYGDTNGQDWPDNHLRFGLLSKVASLLGCAKSPLVWKPHVVHCHDWPAGLAPAYLRFADGPCSATLMTIHNLAFQGLFPASSLQELGLPPQSYAVDGIEYYGHLSFLKGGIHYADRISTVSPTYALEIQGMELGCGMEGLLKHRTRDLAGILNGIDTAVWNSARDPMIVEKYDIYSLEHKAANKTALAHRFHLDPSPELPLLGVVSRLAHQKGMDVLAEVLPHIIAHAAQLVVLGMGEAALEAAFQGLAAEFPRRVALVTGYDESLAHLIEAGADIFLMPSRFEPCGLNQMYSMRYGTPPVVHATGGLSDTVVDCTPASLEAGTATGFVCKQLDANSLRETIGRALDAWRDKPVWSLLQKNGMARDFSWKHPARQYRALYRTLAGIP